MSKGFSDYLFAFHWIKGEGWGVVLLMPHCYYKSHKEIADFEGGLLFWSCCHADTHTDDSQILNGQE